VGLKSTGFPQVYRRGVDMHALTVEGLFKSVILKVLLTCSISTCTMLLEQIKGFYHKIFLLVGSYTMLNWHF